MARPTAYKAEYAERAKQLCQGGATDEDLAFAFEVSERTLGYWRAAHTEFSEAIRDGRRARSKTDALVRKVLRSREARDEIMRLIQRRHDSTPALATPKLDEIFPL